MHDSLQLIASAKDEPIPTFDPGAVRPAAEAVNPIENTACWRRGWNGWGWYPCGGGAYYGGGPDYYHHWRRPYWHENEYADGEHEWHHRDWR